MPNNRRKKQNNASNYSRINMSSNRPYSAQVKRRRMAQSHASTIKTLRKQQKQAKAKNTYQEQIKNILNDQNLYGENMAFQDYSRMRPKRIPQDKERLYEETLHLRKVMKKVKETHSILSQEVQRSERENKQLSQLYQEMESLSTKRTRKNMKKKQSGDLYLLYQLRQQLKKQKGKYNKAKQQLLKLKRNQKYTKIQELEIQLQTFEEETGRMKEALDETIQLRTNEIYNIEKITNLEEKYYMQSNIIDGLRRDNQELSTALKVIEDQNNNLMAIKEVEDKSYEKKNMQIANNKTSIKDQEREYKSLKIQLIRAQERQLQILEQRKNRDYDRKLALKDEKSQRKGGAIKTEYDDKLQQNEQLQKQVDMLEKRLQDRKQKNESEKIKLLQIIEEEKIILADLKVRHKIIKEKFKVEIEKCSSIEEIKDECTGQSKSASQQGGQQQEVTEFSLKSGEEQEEVKAGKQHKPEHMEKEVTLGKKELPQHQPEKQKEPEQQQENSAHTEQKDESIPTVKLGDVQEIIDEIHYRLLNADFFAEPLNDLMSKYDKENVSIIEIMNLFQAEPFAVSDQNSRKLLARFLVEDNSKETVLFNEAQEINYVEFVQQFIELLKLNTLRPSLVEEHSQQIAKDLKLYKDDFLAKHKDFADKDTGLLTRTNLHKLIKQIDNFKKSNEKCFEDSHLEVMIMKLFSVSEGLDQLNFNAIWSLFPYTAPEKAPSELNEEADIDFDDGLGEIEVIEKTDNKAILDIEIKQFLDTNKETITQFLQKFDEDQSGKVSVDDFKSIFGFLDGDLLEANKMERIMEKVADEEGHHIEYDKLWEAFGMQQPLYIKQKEPKRARENLIQRKMFNYGPQKDDSYEEEQLGTKMRVQYEGCPTPNCQQELHYNHQIKGYECLGCGYKSNKKKSNEQNGDQDLNKSKDDNVDAFDMDF